MFVGENGCHEHDSAGNHAERIAARLQRKTLKLRRAGRIRAAQVRRVGSALQEIPAKLYVT